MTEQRVLIALGTFPFMWDDDDGHEGPPVNDPTLIEVPLDDIDELFDDYGVTGKNGEEYMRFSLSGVVDDFISAFMPAWGAETGEKISDPKDVSKLMAVAADLRRLADHIESFTFPDSSGAREAHASVPS